jgi:hypothetical protein
MTWLHEVASDAVEWTDWQSRCREQDAGLTRLVGLMEDVASHLAAAGDSLEKLNRTLGIGHQSPARPS